MILKANQKYIDMSAVRHLLANGEKNADFLTFEVDRDYHGVDLSDCTFILRAVNSAGNLAEQTLKKHIDNNSIFLTWKVDEYFTAVSGVLKLEIRGIKGDELVIKYGLSDIFVRESAVGEGVPDIPDTTVIQGEKGDKGDDGKSAYEIWLELGNTGTEADFLNFLKGNSVELSVQNNSLVYRPVDYSGHPVYMWTHLYNMGLLKGEKGDAGERGLQGIQGEKGDKGDDGQNGENGKDGKDGSDGKSAYETWLELGNTGTESDFLKSLKGEKGDTGERGLQGIKGEKGDKGDIGQKGENGMDGTDGFSPEIEVSENTENAYKLRITDKNSSFETPNLMGKNGTVGAYEIDAELSGTSENAVQNKVISGEISALKNQISNLNNLISAIQSGGGNLKIITLFDSSDHEKYKDLWNFRCSQWDDRIFAFDEVTAKNSAFCSAENGYCMKFSNSFGWGADVTAMFLDSIQIINKSILIVEYNCTSDGEGMTAEIISEPDFTSQKSAEFEVIPAFYAVNTFISANFKVNSVVENGAYYVRFKVNTTNPAFTIRKISVITQE